MCKNQRFLPRISSERRCTGEDIALRRVCVIIGAHCFGCLGISRYYYYVVCFEKQKNKNPPRGLFYPFLFEMFYFGFFRVVFSCHLRWPCIFIHKTEHCLLIFKLFRLCSSTFHLQLCVSYKLLLEHLTVVLRLLGILGVVADVRRQKWLKNFDL